MSSRNESNELELKIQLLQNKCDQIKDDYEAIRYEK